jgi:hypothetical protein
VDAHLRRHKLDASLMPGCLCLARDGLVRRPPPCARADYGALWRPPVITLSVGDVSGGLPDSSSLAAQGMAPFCRVSGVGQSVEESAQGEGLLMGETRHTFASHLVMRGANLRSAQELLGHKTGKKTVRYTHLSTPHLQETVNLLDSLLVLAPCRVEQGR